MATIRLPLFLLSIGVIIVGLIDDNSWKLWSSPIRLLDPKMSFAIFTIKRFDGLSGLSIMWEHSNLIQIKADKLISPLSTFSKMQCSISPKTYGQRQSTNQRQTQCTKYHIPFSYALFADILQISMNRSIPQNLNSNPVLIEM